MQDSSCKTLKKLASLFYGPKGRKANVAGIKGTMAYDLDYNLMGAVIDIQETGKCDKISLNTLKKTLRKLSQMRKVLAEWQSSTEETS